MITDINIASLLKIQSCFDNGTLLSAINLLTLQTELALLILQFYCECKWYLMVLLSFHNPVFLLLGTLQVKAFSNNCQKFIWITACFVYSIKEPWSFSWLLWLSCLCCKVLFVTFSSHFFFTSWTCSNFLIPTFLN